MAAVMGVTPRPGLRTADPRTPGLRSAELPTPNLLTARLRASPAWELVLFDRLSEPEQRALEPLRHDPDGYGVLRPRQSGTLTLRAVSRDTALLWLTLQQPGPLPQYALRIMGESCEPFICQLILDGILEIEHEGSNHCGPAALPLLTREPLSQDATSGIAQLSRRALEIAAALPIADPLALSSRLYSYNTAPATPQWRQRWRDLDFIERDLGIENDAWHKLLPGWSRVASGNSWIAWSRVTPTPELNPTPSEPTCKLYVSPACDFLCPAFQEAAAAMAPLAIHLKIGASVFGLLRPDKMVGYFRSLDDLREAAEQIRARLADCPAQGVPFTAQIDGSPLLSWGVDPLRDTFDVPWLQGESWRLRICNRLAAALVQARASATEDSPADPDIASLFALRRLEFEGIDTRTWAPTSGLLWSQGL